MIWLGVVISGLGYWLVTNVYESSGITAELFGIIKMDSNTKNKNKEKDKTNK